MGANRPLAVGASVHRLPITLALLSLGKQAPQSCPGVTGTFLQRSALPSLLLPKGAGNPQPAATEHGPDSDR